MTNETTIEGDVMRILTPQHRPELKKEKNP